VAVAAAQKSLLEALQEVPDPRRRHGRRYQIASIPAMAVCAMACGARSAAAIAQWGKCCLPQWVHGGGPEWEPCRRDALCNHTATWPHPTRSQPGEHSGRCLDRYPVPEACPRIAILRSHLCRRQPLAWGM
jgi:hypothetical protein